MKGDNNIKNCDEGKILNNFLEEYDKYKCCPIKYVNANNTPETIEIGDVITVNYDEGAKITDKKKGNTHVLNFMIPRGMNGQSDTIKVGTVTTVEPKDEAKVIDRTGSPVHTFDFFIPRGNPGPIIPSSTEGIFFTDFNELTTSGEMIFNNTWLIPSLSDIFTIIDENKVEVVPGIYEISLSGLITGLDNDNSAEIYLLTDKGSAIKDLSFKFPKGSGSQSYFSKTTLFRFEEESILDVSVNILSDLQAPTISISEVNLLLKKIRE